MNRPAPRHPSHTPAEHVLSWRDPVWLEEIDEDFGGDEAEVRRMVELTGMVGVDCALHDRCLD